MEVNILDVISYMSQNRLVQINLLNEDGITYCQRHEKDGTVRQLELKDTSYSAEQTKLSLIHI